LPQFSTDGNNWQSLDKIPITNIHQRSYQTLHSPAPAGTLFYRIQQADVDGKIIYSSVVMLNALGTQTGVHVYPNPVRQNGNVNISGAGISPSNIQLRDANGRLLRSATMSTGMYTLSTTGLPAGVYYVQVQSAQGLSTRKITIVQ
ncbi:MAG TPA: T9SS type A sorting domain-containing protein, partial [Phnomibacter sp.]|nr:T9SS type A sorting domain-containing protein [Phnomibacter sp.]